MELQTKMLNVLPKHLQGQIVRYFNQIPDGAIISGTRTDTDSGKTEVAYGIDFKNNIYRLRIETRDPSRMKTVFDLFPDNIKEIASQCTIFSCTSTQDETSYLVEFDNGSFKRVLLGVAFKKEDVDMS